MPRARFGLLAAILFLGSAIQGCGSAPLAATPAPPPTLAVLAAFPTARPTATPQPGRIDFNITQADYEQALAKWRSYGITEYEITIDDASGMVMVGKVRLRIKIVDGKPYIINYTDLNGTRPEKIDVDDYTREQLSSLTVERQFDLIGTRLNNKISLSPGVGVHYTIRFDPFFGYPDQVDVIGTFNGLIRNDGVSIYEVLSLRILKSNLPGMPKTGHPDP
jgi:hypothetical protein